MVQIICSSFSHPLIIGDYAGYIVRVLSIFVTLTCVVNLISWSVIKGEILIVQFILFQSAFERLLRAETFSLSDSTRKRCCVNVSKV